MEKSKPILAFVDEFGTNSFKFESQGSHFIVAAVICKKDNLDKLNEGVEYIRKRHRFQTGEIKSSRIAKKHDKRIRILKDIVDLDISVFAIVVNKRELNSKGFQYKKPFYKFLNNLLYKELYRTFPKIGIYVDEVGGNDFLLDFKKYVKKNHQRNLFEGSEFDVLDSKNEPLIQIADFVVGSLGYVYDELKKNDKSSEILDVLQPILSAVNLFPIKYSINELQESSIDEGLNPLISQLSAQRIINYLDSAKPKHIYDYDRLNFLNLMTLYQRVYPKSKFVSTKEILKHLNKNRAKQLNEEAFRSKVVGALRDKGILISSSRKGYKIPISIDDINKYLNHGNSIILPMVSRIKELRKAIKVASHNEIDVLDSFPELKEILKEV